MEILFQVVTSFLVAASSITGGGFMESEVAPSVELGLYEVSPKGEEGGFAMPASGCSVAVSHGEDIHDCNQMPDISTDKPIVRLGDPVRVSWDPQVHVGCILSPNVMSLVTPPNPTTLPNANAVGSRIDIPTGETTYTILCAGNAGDSVSIKVLPRIQES